MVFLRAATLVAGLATVAACTIVPNPAYDGGIGDGSTGPEDDDGSSTAPAAETGDACDPSPTQGAGPCPPECDGCLDGVCRIDCLAQGGCKDADVVCPPGWPCLLQCEGKDACHGAFLACTGTHACEVDCSGEHACDQVALQCGEGACRLVCGEGNDACRRARMECGPGPGIVECTAPQKELDMVPTQSSSCGCEVASSCHDGDG